MISGTCGGCQTQPTRRKTITLIEFLHRPMLKFVGQCLNSRSIIIYFTARHSIRIVLPNESRKLVGRNVLGCSERCNTNITCCFDIKYLNRVANTMSDDVGDSVAMLFKCSDGVLLLSNSDDIEPLNYSS